jgi:hypothetical protein
MDGRMLLPNKGKALSSNPRTTKNKTKQTNKKSHGQNPKLQIQMQQCVKTGEFRRNLCYVCILFLKIFYT